MAGALGGGGCNRPENSDSSTTINSMLSIIIAATRSAIPPAIAAEAGRALPPGPRVARLRPGAEAVLLPGEPERARAGRARSGSGVPLDRTTWGQLLETARGVGCAVDEGALLAAP